MNRGTGKLWQLASRVTWLANLHFSWNLILKYVLMNQLSCRISWHLFVVFVLMNIGRVICLNKKYPVTEFPKRIL